jgi:hypothetical protein
VSESRHVSVWIERPARDVYRFASDPARLAEWAAGLSSGLGDITVEFAPDNELGVLDHVVTLPSRESVYNAMRVIPAANAEESRCEVVFTVRRRDLSNDEFEADAAAVAADLETLRGLLES